MTRNSYLGSARLASHPVFSYRATALACPICRRFITLKMTDYDRLAARHGWPLTAQLVSEGKS